MLGNVTYCVVAVNLPSSGGRVWEVMALTAAASWHVLPAVATAGQLHAMACH
jgi:hypothetical protein